MDLRKFVILILLVTFSFSGSYAQKWKLKRYEAVAGVGTAHYFGDIGGTADMNNLMGIKDIELFNARPSFYLGARFKIRHNMAVKTNFVFGFLKGDDEGSRNNERNLSFSSKIFEFSGQYEYSIISEEQRYRTTAMFNRRGMINNYSRYNFYAFAGLGLVKGWPKLEKDDVPVENTKNGIGLALPIGLGLKYVMNSNLSLGIEFGGRITTTDYLDGYTSSFSEHNDIYYFAVFNAIYRIKTSRNGLPIFGRRTSFI